MAITSHMSRSHLANGKDILWVWNLVFTIFKLLISDLTKRDTVEGYVDVDGEGMAVSWSLMSSSAPVVNFRILKLASIPNLSLLPPNLPCIYYDVELQTYSIHPPATKKQR